MFNIDLKINLSNHLINKLGKQSVLRGLNELSDSTLSLISKEQRVLSNIGASFYV